MSKPPHPLAGAVGKGPPIAPSEWRWKCGNRLYDMYFFSPDGKKYRSKKQLAIYLDTLENGPSLKDFCWNVTKDKLQGTEQDETTSPTTVVQKKINTNKESSPLELDSNKPSFEARQENTKLTIRTQKEYQYVTNQRKAVQDEKIGVTNNNQQELVNVRRNFQICCLHFQTQSYLFKDVLADGNCAFHAICGTRILPTIDHYELRLQMCNFARTTGRYIAECIFQYYASIDISQLNIDQYIQKMTNYGQFAGLFEFIMIAFMFKVNFVVVSQTTQQHTTNIHAELNKRFKQLLQNGEIWHRVIYLLHHKSGKPSTPSSVGNHFGMLFPITSLQSRLNKNALEALLETILRENQDNTQLLSEEMEYIPTSNIEKEPCRSQHPMAEATGEGPPIAPWKWKWKCGTRVEDMYFYSPEGKRFRSKKILNRYLSTLKDGPTPNNFCWTVTKDYLESGKCKRKFESNATFLFLGTTRYLFMDVQGDGNCAFHAICDSQLIKGMSHSKLREETCKYARTIGRTIAETIFQLFASLDVTNLNLDEYLDQMSKDATFAGTFEFIMIAFMFDINIIVLTQTRHRQNTNVHRDLDSLFPNLVREVKWNKCLHLLHHIHGKPDIPCIEANHFGILFSVTDAQYKDNMHSPQSLLTAFLCTNYNSSRIQKVRNEPLRRYQESVLRSKRRRSTKNDQAQEREYKRNSKFYDNSPSDTPIGSAASNDTNVILNRLTKANLSDEQQNELLEHTPNEHFHYILNMFGKLIGESELPTVMCAVCACKHKLSNIQRLFIDEVPNLHLLEAAQHHRTLDITQKYVMSNDAIFVQSESIPILSKMIDKKSITKFDIDICNKCEAQLTKGTVPKRSLASFDSGTIPEELQSIRLTFAERMLLSCNFTSFHIFKIQPNGKSSRPDFAKPRVSKGHSISFKHSSTQSAIKRFILPHDPKILPELMITCYIGPAKTAEEAREMVRNTNQLKVRTKIVHKFAMEYAKLNPTKISHDPSRYNDHLEGTVPDFIFDMIDFDALVDDPTLQRPTFVQMDDSMHDDYAKRDQIRPDEWPDPNVDIVQRSGMVLPHVLSNGMQELKETSVRKLNTEIFAIPTSKKPVSDYDRQYFVNTYPNIFLHGVGERPLNVSLPTYLKTLMRRPSTGAATDYSFPFEARNILLRHRTLFKVKLSISLEHTSLIPDITDEDLASALQAIHNNEPINDRVRTLLKQLQITGADLRGTPQRLNQYRQQILTGLFPLFGPFDVWITLNIQESSSQVLLRIAGEQEIPISYDVPKNVPNITRRMQICAENPLAVADFFDIFMKAFLEGLLGLPHGANDLCPIHKGVFGWTRAYMFILEVSGKATGPHAHGVLKIQGLNRDKLVQRFYDPVLIKLYKQYLLSTFSQDLPNKAFDIEGPIKKGLENELIRSRRAEEQCYRYVNPTIIKRNEHYMGMYPLQQLPVTISTEQEQNDIEQYLSKRLIQILRECGIHEHSATCKKNGHVGDDTDCWMSYPQPIFEEIALFLDEHIDDQTKQVTINGIEVIFPRDHPFLVAMNKWITLALASNTAIYYMASGRQGRTRALYSTDYATKKPLSTYECITLFRASLQAKRKQQALLDTDNIIGQNSCLSTSMIINRCLNALTGEIVVTGYECCADIVELPEHYASNSFVPLSAWSYMYSMLGRESRRSFNVISKHDQLTNEKKATLVSATQDYVYLDMPDAEKMTAYEFTAFYQRVSKIKDNRGAKKLDKQTDQLSQSREHEIDLIDSELNIIRENHPENITTSIGRPMHKRIGFTANHKLFKTHHVYRLAKMQVPYQVGRQYPSLPPNNDESSVEKLEVYSQYMLSIFRPWSTTMNNKCNEGDTWWSTLQNYLNTCPAWIPTVIQNMNLAIERDDTTTKANNNMQKISTNAMNHADKKFEYVDDSNMDQNEQIIASAELLQMLEMDMIISGLDISRPPHTSEQEYVRSGIQVLSKRYEDHNFPSQASWLNNKTMSSIINEDKFGNTSTTRIKNWKIALKELVRCNDENIDYDMNKATNLNKSTPSTIDDSSFFQNVTTLLTDPIFVPMVDPAIDPRYEKTTSRPDWKRLPTPPTIVDTLKAWHLTKTQSEFVIMVLTHFHNSKEGKDQKQLLGLCLGAPGTGKSQAMLAIIWHMSHHTQMNDLRHKVATCAFTGGAAMLISTPHTVPMTTCRQFQINLKGPNKSQHAVHVLTMRLGRLQYVFIDEFSFLSYRHLRDIAEQIVVGLGERAQKDKPFGGMNFVFFGDYEQLSKPGGFSMYHGAAAEESIDPEDMNAWFANEMQSHTDKSTYDPSYTFMGRDLWTSIDIVRTLTVQKRQADNEAGRRLLARCQALRHENFPDSFFDSLQEKAITTEQLRSDEWSNPLYIVMRHTLRVPIDFQEAEFQARRQSKRFVMWRTVDTVKGRKLPNKLQAIVNSLLIEKVPKFQYFYQGMSLAFIDNNYFAAGNATNNLGYAISITLDPREPPDDFTKPRRELVHLPLYVLVQVPNAQMTRLSPDLPAKVIPIFPTKQYKKVRLGDNRHKVLEGKNISHISIARLGMRWLGVHAVTQYFSQGMSLSGRKCIVDLRLPFGISEDYAQSVLVMLSRHNNDNDWAMLHPLWTNGNELERMNVINSMKKALSRNEDLHAEMRRIKLVEIKITEPYLQGILKNRRDLQEHLRSIE